MGEEERAKIEISIGLFLAQTTVLDTATAFRSAKEIVRIYLGEKIMPQVAALTAPPTH